MRDESVPADAAPSQLASVVALTGLRSFTVFHGLRADLLAPAHVAAFLKARRRLGGLFAVAFGWACFEIPTARPQ